MEDLFFLMSCNAYKDGPLDIIDVCQAYKLLYGRPFVGKKGEEPWNIWNLIKKQKIPLSCVNELNSCFYKMEKVEDRVLSERVNIFLILLRKIWVQVSKRLKQADESTRFFQLEKPINELFLDRHLKGIKVSQQCLQTRLNFLDRNISTSARSLKEEYKIRDIANLDDLIKALRGEGLHSFESRQGHLDETLDFYSEQQILPKLIKTYRDSRRDKDILLRLGAINSDRVHPVYKCLGTITGRILVDSPNLQNLKKINRDIIEPDGGMKFLYPDYSQFEPGIMADQAQDEVLIRDFNSGDLYLKLSSQVFGDVKYRQSAKLLFLAFCYGMKVETMSQIAAESAGCDRDATEKVIFKFFGRYQRLIAWREEIEFELLRNKRIGTVLGNYRHRDYRRKSLSDLEKRWVISQRIQGTASVILKKVMIGIQQSLSDVDILLPMHDALLVQVPTNKEQQLKVEIERIFLN